MCNTTSIALLYATLEVPYDLQCLWSNDVTLFTNFIFYFFQCSRDGRKHLLFEIAAQECQRIVRSGEHSGQSGKLNIQEIRFSELSAEFCGMHNLGRTIDGHILQLPVQGIFNHTIVPHRIYSTRLSNLILKEIRFDYFVCHTAHQIITLGS